MTFKRLKKRLKLFNNFDKNLPVYVKAYDDCGNYIERYRVEGCFVNFDGSSVIMINIDEGEI